MPSKWKFPRVGEAWSECQWCGQEFPASQVWLNPRYGWQCYKCWDGLYQRDQILQPIFPYEGTRRTPSPIIPEDEGVGGDLEPTYDYFLTDRFTGTTYLVHIPPLYITATGLIVYYGASAITVTAATPSDDDVVYTEIQINGPWAIFVGNGVIQTEEIPLVPPAGLLVGECDFGDIASLCSVYMQDFLSGDVYLVDFDARPITITLAASYTGTVFAATLVDDGYFVVLSGSLTAYALPPAEGPIFTNDCIHVASLLGLPSDGGGTGTGDQGGIPTDDGPPPSITPCETNVAFLRELFEDVYCDTPVHFLRELFNS